MAKKPGIPKGTRDFSPTEIAKRNYILSKIREQFELFGFQPIETPAMENAETLLGKYGEEGDRLIFKILNSGDYLSKVDAESLEKKDSNLLSSKISEKALRYDLTVPFARYVVMHQNEIEFPFKRYQMQPVWRADRPQRGRFREFYQCDADVVGATSLWQEVELVQLYDQVFSELKIPEVTIKLNSRKVLLGIVEAIGADQQLVTSFLVALDKLDKIGIESVKEEMRQKGIAEGAIQKAEPLFQLTGSDRDPIPVLKEFLSHSPIGLEGIKDLEFVKSNIDKLGLRTTRLAIDVTLARGLNYYTGCIFEVTAPDKISVGSIGGGGRYDDLTGIFGLKDVSGVGISFGMERIYMVMEELNLFPEELGRQLDVLCLNFGDKEALAAMILIGELRSAGIKADLYPNKAKIQKQMKYANNRKVPYVISLGEDELTNHQFQVKNMDSGEQKTYSLSQASEFIRSL